MTQANKNPKTKRKSRVTLYRSEKIPPESAFAGLRSPVVFDHVIMSVATKTLIRLNSAGNTWYDSRNNEVHFSSDMPSCICHMERNICDNFELRFRDEESDGAYYDLDLETNGSALITNLYPLKKCTALARTLIYQILYDCLRPSCMCLFYRWRIVVIVTYLRIQVCHCNICPVSLSRLSGPIPKIRGGLTTELMVH